MGIARRLALAGLAALPLFALAFPTLGETIELEELMKPGPLPEQAMGSTTAPVTIIEYASMTCSHCQAFHEKTLPSLKAKYIDTGKVRFILREFPLDPLATGAIMLARCAPAEDYFAMVDLLFEKQREWAFVDKPIDALVALAKRVGFTQASFKTCITDQTLYENVTAVKERAAEKFGVSATPTFFINGVMRRGIFSADEVDELIPRE